MSHLALHRAAPCSHIFEAVDEDRPADAAASSASGGSGVSSSGSGKSVSLEQQIRALEAALEEMRRKRGGT